MTRFLTGLWQVFWPLFWACGFLVWLCPRAQADVRITEFMASNNGPWLDRDGDNSDWIEIHNDAAAAVNLEGILSHERLSFFSPPTPGLKNGPGYSGWVNDTKFSVNRGFYTTPFTVTITTATADAQIFWTTDSRTPSPTNGTLYTGPVAITNTTILRAAAHRPGYLPTDGVSRHVKPHLQRARNGFADGAPWVQTPGRAHPRHESHGSG